MKKKFQLITEYEDFNDSIRAYVKDSSEVLAEIEYDCQTMSIRCKTDDPVSKFQIVNVFELIAKVTQALLDATDENSDIPMMIEEPMTIYL